MRVMTQVLIGPALDHAIAVCEGADIVVVTDISPDGTGGSVIFLEPHESGIQDGQRYSPSTNWEQAEPIIGRAEISLTLVPAQAGWFTNHEAYWQASIGADKAYRQIAPTPLIAAMRCVLASRVGKWVDIPDELAGADLLAAQSEAEGMELFHSVCDGEPPAVCSKGTKAVGIPVGWLFRIRAGKGRGPWVHSNEPVETRGDIEAVQAIGLPYPHQTLQAMTVRDGFEEWARRQAYPIAKMGDDTYLNIGTMERYEAWCAALRNMGYEFGG